MTHVMIDIETLSTQQSASIIQISAQQFIEGSRAFSVLVTPVIGHVDPKTLVWWTKQDRNLLKEAKETGHTIGTAIELLSDFLQPDDLVYSNGADFDISILKNTMEFFNMDWPVHYTNSRCYRTLLAMRYNKLSQEQKDVKPTHDSLENCKLQIDRLLSLYWHCELV